MSTITRRELLFASPGAAVAQRLLGGRLLAQSAPLRVLGLNQVTLAVSDVARSVAFYQRLFGMPVQARHGDGVLLRLGDGPHFIKLVPAGAEPPRIDHWGFAIEGFEVERVLRTLDELGVSRAIGGQGLSGGALRVRVHTRDGTPELYMGDPDGLVVQLQDSSYCGGGGPLGSECTVTPGPAGAPLSLRGLNHLTVNVPDPDATNEFWQRTCGFDIQAYQAASPLLGVGPGRDFLMFIAAGGRGAGAARVNHVSLALEGFDVARIQAALEGQGIRPRPDGGAGPLLHWVSMRMPNRGGAPEGTPELDFSDPDGLSVQLQDVTYCGGGGDLGEIC
jgi:catechol 2,3-dioxygenase-like lactoylglutathione lyase family enzyme